jgi:hypothetical protein
MAQSTPRETSTSFPLSDRFDHGNFEISEVLELAKVSKTKFYEDVKAGLVCIVKRGAKSIIRGPIARAYIQGSKPGAKG